MNKKEVAKKRSLYKHMDIENHFGGHFISPTIWL